VAKPFGKEFCWQENCLRVVREDKVATQGEVVTIFVFFGIKVNEVQRYVRVLCRDVLLDNIKKAKSK